jgi:hypothetical protein
MLDSYLLLLQVGGMMVNKFAKFKSHMSMDFENI